MYADGKNRHSMAPSRSSTVAIAHRSPFFVRFSCRLVISPATVTGVPSGLPSSPMSAAIGVSACVVRMCSMPNSGWSET